MKTGTVKFFDNSKGFAFIKDDESGNENFVHISGLIDEIRENDKVLFNLKQGAILMAVSNSFKVPFRVVRTREKAGKIRLFLLFWSDNEHDFFIM